MSAPRFDPRPRRPLSRRCRRSVRSTASISTSAPASASPSSARAARARARWRWRSPGLLPASASSTARIDWPGLEPCRRERPRHRLRLPGPGASLDPVMTVGEQIAEVARTPSRYQLAAGATNWPSSCIGRVKLPEPERSPRPIRTSFPAARRSASRSPPPSPPSPKLLIADEATSALDTIVQAEIVALIDGLVAEGRHVADLHQPRHRAGLAARRPHRRVPRTATWSRSADAQVIDAPREPYTQRR